MNKAVIIPTGGEILDGTVLDTDSPMIQALLQKKFRNITVTVERPVEDVEDDICTQVRLAVEQGADLVIVIGGSGGGHRYSTTLAKDYTHTGLAKLLEETAITSLYGKNGHLWSRLVCGRLGSAIVFNVPGPYHEAKHAMEAVCGMDEINISNIGAINTKIALAVQSCYTRRKNNERNDE